jgi:hypothetical protein
MVECTVSPFAHVSETIDEERLEVMLDALIADDRALGAYVLRGPAGGMLSTTFRVELPAGDDLLERARAVACAVFDDALQAAGLLPRTAGVSVAEGGEARLASVDPLHVRSGLLGDRREVA